MRVFFVPKESKPKVFERASVYFLRPCINKVKSLQPTGCFSKQRIFEKQSLFQGVYDLSHFVDQIISTKQT